MIQSYDELIGKIQELFKDKEDYNGFILTDPDCCQVCREEKGGFYFAEVHDSPNKITSPNIGVYLTTFIDPDLYTKEDLEKIGAYFYESQEGFLNLPKRIQMECVFEELTMWDCPFTIRTFDEIYDLYLNLLNTQYERKEAIA